MPNEYTHTELPSPADTLFLRTLVKEEQHSEGRTNEAAKNGTVSLRLLKLF